MSAPTRAEIRAAVQDALDSPCSMVMSSNRTALVDVIDEPATILRDAAWTVLESTDSRTDRAETERGGLWGDLRPSEARRLMELYEQAVYRASERCIAIVAEELTAATMTFATEHPDAPRPAVAA